MKEIQNRHRGKLLLSMMLLTGMCISATRAWATENLKLWYDRPAQEWTEALPVGNGRMGAMVFGGVGEARYQFNEDTLWTGGPRSYANPGAAEYLEPLRQLLLAGKQKEAEQLAMRHFMSVPLGQMAYQPFGDVLLKFPGHEGAAQYHRSLELDTAIATTTYQVNGATFTRQTFASYPDRTIVIHLTCDRPGQLEFTAELTSPQADISIGTTSERTLLLTGRVRDSDNKRAGEPKGQMKYAAHLNVLETDGECGASDGELRISGATTATLVLTAGTNHVNFRDISADPRARSEEDLQQLKGKTFAELKATHLEDHQELFRRVSINLGPESAEHLPTDDRILAYAERSDPALAALLFQYGRYLMIASSRPGSQPANLQGVWNDQLEPSWDSKYTVNINTEMNYWVTEPCNLSECGEPLFAALEELVESGRETAQAHYNAPGWVLHHNFDLWRGTAPINASNHGIWPTGGAWLCQHLWWHYQYTGDEEFLRERAYPIMRGAADFFAHYLFEDPRSSENWLISGPSNSPELGGLVLGPSMDHQIIRELFANTIEAAAILEVHEEFRQELVELRSRIAPNQIGRLGQLQEWLEDIDNPNERHRHVSHLWGLHPGSEITPETPDLFAASQKSLGIRGDGGTGWSLAWKNNFWARLLDGDHAHKMIGNLLTLTGSPKSNHRGGGVYPNLFDAHPPFQVDGNFGATSGICEMLLQSHLRTDDGRVIVDALPALPSAWPTGSVTGLRTRDGLELAITWQDGKLTECKIHSHLGKSFVLRYGSIEREFDTYKGISVTVDGELKPIDERR